MQYFGKFGPMLGKVAIQVKLPHLQDSCIRAKLLLPDGSAFQNKVFDLLVTKSNFINTLNDSKSLLDWTHEWGRSQSELKGRKNVRNSVMCDLDGDTYLLGFELSGTAISQMTPAASSESPTLEFAGRRANSESELPRAPKQSNPPRLSTLVAREFLYRQLARLELQPSGQLPDSPGLYAVFEPGQQMGERFRGLASEPLRCVKFGMTKGQTIRKRINGQYCGKSHRASIARMLVGDALIGHSILECRNLAGIPAENLAAFRELWNVGSSEGNVLQKRPAIAREFGLKIPEDVRKLEATLEAKVTDIIREWRFAAIPAGEADIDLIEDSANSLLSDLSKIDPATDDWLGKHSSRVPVRERGLWASNGVEGGRLYCSYGGHPSSNVQVDETSEPIADWLVRLADLISSRVKQ
jgi:hypothetical protein